MTRKNTKLIIGLGNESSLIVQNTNTNAEKFCMNFSEVLYPKQEDLLKYGDTEEMIRDDDFWWCGEDIFDNFQEPVFKNLIKNKKAIVIVVSKMGQKEAGFTDALIRYAGNRRVVLILNKNQIEESLFKHFSKKCRVIDTFYTKEFQEKIYDKELNIKPKTSILEMEARLNMLFMKRIEEAVTRCTKGIKNLTKDEKTKIIDDARLEAERIISNARKNASEILSENELLKAVQKEAEKIKAQAVAECEKMKRKTMEECAEMKRKTLEEELWDK